MRTRVVLKNKLTKINYVNDTLPLPKSNEEIIWFHVAVNERLRVNILQPPQELVG